MLQAQTEIADTYFLEGNLEESGRFFQLLLRLDSPKLNRAQIQFKLIRSLTGLAAPRLVSDRAGL